jgi:TRAP-type mannitol/chloroaromatic compound transport system permease small subunit
MHFLELLELVAIPDLLFVLPSNLLDMYMFKKSLTSQFAINENSKVTCNLLEVLIFKFS